MKAPRIGNAVWTLGVVALAFLALAVVIDQVAILRLAIAVPEWTRPPFLAGFDPGDSFHWDPSFFERFLDRSNPWTHGVLGALALAIGLPVRWVPIREFLRTVGASILASVLVLVLVLRIDGVRLERIGESFVEVVVVAIACGIVGLCDSPRRRAIALALGVLVLFGASTSSPVRSHCMGPVPPPTILRSYVFSVAGHLVGAGVIAALGVVIARRVARSRGDDPPGRRVRMLERASVGALVLAAVLPATTYLVVFREVWNRYVGPNDAYRERRVDLPRGPALRLVDQGTDDIRDYSGIATGWGFPARDVVRVTPTRVVVEGVGTFALPRDRDDRAWGPIRAALATPCPWLDLRHADRSDYHVYLEFDRHLRWGRVRPILEALREATPRIARVSFVVLADIPGPARTFLGRDTEWARLGFGLSEPTVFIPGVIDEPEPVPPRGDSIDVAQTPDTMTIQELHDRLLRLRSALGPYLIEFGRPNGHAP